MIHD